MRPRERRETGQNDLFKARLDQIVDMNHALVKLAGAIDWSFLEKSFGAVYNDGPGQPPLPTRLMAGLAILKHMHDLSDEILCERWIENPYYQLFCGEEFFQHKLPFDRSSMTRWRQRMGEEKLAALLQESLATATRSGAAKPADFAKVIIDTTVQPKAVAFPTDARRMHCALDRLARLAKRHGIKLRQSYRRIGKFALIKQQRYAHAKHPDSSRKFHIAYDPRNHQANPEVSQQLFYSYPAAVRARLKTFTRNYKVLRGRELSKLGIKDCNEPKTNAPKIMVASAAAGKPPLATQPDAEKPLLAGLWQNTAAYRCQGGAGALQRGPAPTPALARILLAEAPLPPARPAELAQPGRAADAAPFASKLAAGRSPTRPALPKIIAGAQPILPPGFRAYAGLDQ